MFEDHASGAASERPNLTACLDYLRQGDVLVVLDLDRLGRRAGEPITLIDELDQRGIGFRALNSPMDTTTPAGRAFLQLQAAFAEMERNVIRQRVREGVKAARARGRKGGRPLHWVGSTAAIAALLAADADPNAKTDDGQIPADSAQRSLNSFHIRDRNIVVWLRSAALLDNALDGKADLDTKDVDGNTPLHWAATLGHTAGIAALLDAGADPNERNGWEQTPLHLTAGEGHTAAVTALLDADADPYAKDMRGNNALRWALSERHTEAAAILRAAMGQ